MASLKIRTAQQISDELAQHPEKGGSLDGLGKLLDTQYVELGGLLYTLFKLSKLHPEFDSAFKVLSMTLLHLSTISGKPNE